MSVKCPFCQKQLVTNKDHDSYLETAYYCMNVGNCNVNYSIYFFRSKEYVDVAYNDIDFRLAILDSKVLDLNFSFEEDLSFELQNRCIDFFQKEFDLISSSGRLYDLKKEQIMHLIDKVYMLWSRLYKIASFS